MKRMAVVAALVVLAACTDSPEPREPEPTSSAATSAPSTNAGGNDFDRLTMSLELKADEMPTSFAVGSHITVRNESDRPVRDPGCVLAAYRFALVPVDDPDAELWGQVVVDCAGPFTLRPGYVDRQLGPTFQATDKFGEPLPPGEYIATVAFDLRSEPLTQPITVTD